MKDTTRPLGKHQVWALYGVRIPFSPSGISGGESGYIQFQAPTESMSHMDCKIPARDFSPHIAFEGTT